MSQFALSIVNSVPDSLFCAFVAATSRPLALYWSLFRFKIHFNFCSFPHLPCDFYCFASRYWIFSRHDISGKKSTSDICTELRWLSAALACMQLASFLFLSRSRQRLCLAFPMLILISLCLFSPYLITGKSPFFTGLDADNHVLLHAVSSKPHYFLHFLLQ